MHTKAVRNSRSRLAKYLGWILVTLLLSYFALSWYVLKVTVTPRRMTNTITPDQVGLDRTEFIAFRNGSDGMRLQGWFVPCDGKRAVVLMHGIHSQAWDGSLIDLTHEYVRVGIDVLLFDLRGHAWSEGNLSGLGVRERGDVSRAVDQLLARGFEPGRIGLHGLSYGAAVALLAAPAIEEVGAIIADSSFARAQDVLAGEISRETDLPPSISSLVLPGIRVLGNLLYSLDVSQSAPEESIALLGARPVLLIHGTKDDIIPFAHAQRLREAGGANVELWPLPGYRHTEGLRLHPGYPEWSPMRQEYLRKVTEFFLKSL